MPVVHLTGGPQKEFWKVLSAGNAAKPPTAVAPEVPRHFYLARERVLCLRIMFSKDGTETRQSRLRPCGVTPVWP
jgi:hypothetical protein